MDSTLIAGIITGGATIVAALIGAYVAARRRQRPDQDNEVGPTVGGQSTTPQENIIKADQLNPDEQLATNQSITSNNGRFRLTLQADGNLVLYSVSDHRALWSSGTQGFAVSLRLIMQSDGNLVIYGPGPGGQSVWVSDTGVPGSRLVVQDDGNVVIYRPDGMPVWATDTWIPTGTAAQGDDMQPGEVLNPGEAINSENGQYTFVYQVDGNL